MAHYLASYDLHRVRLRNRHAMLYKLQSWAATRVLESAWVFKSDLSVSQLREELLAASETGDAFVVFELKPESSWACEKWLARLEPSFGTSVVA
ncbi:hypothetical protein [Bradyrhizobium sp. 141]|uniref:hypothetical protein n=1 Tax=Bradyrhizobium sp. 141 TaxID=2782617 RepID=UPI001FFB2628|nr:hypothetical protein [Bradyrhizobium sp. 141]MCK1718173.1 hypothetical protein [Bradyrhizobium sp. 141]